jgi:hypothetical protein
MGLDGSYELVGRGGVRFRFVTSEASGRAAVAAAADRVGLGVEWSGRVFSPGLESRFAPDERDYILDGDGEPPAAAVPGQGMVGAPPWGTLAPAANARALEVWAKKQAWMVWHGAWPEGGLAGFSVFAGGGPRAWFWPAEFPEAPGLIAWVCTGDPGITGVDAVWAGEVAAGG